MRPVHLRSVTPSIGSRRATSAQRVIWVTNSGWFFGQFRGARRPGFRSNPSQFDTVEHRPTEKSLERTQQRGVPARTNRYPVAAGQVAQRDGWAAASAVPGDLPAHHATATAAGHPNETPLAMSPYREKDRMKLTVEVTLAKRDGPKQDEDAVRDALDEAVTDIGSIYAQDGEHDDETEYEITKISVLASTDCIAGGVVSSQYLR